MADVNQASSLSELFSDRSRWIQGAFARNAYGASVSSMDKEAVCFCLSGGLTRVYAANAYVYYPKYEKLKAIAMKRDPAIGSLVGFNDKHTYEEVMSLIQEAGV